IDVLEAELDRRARVRTLDNDGVACSNECRATVSAAPATAGKDQAKGQGKQSARHQFIHRVNCQGQSRPPVL
ncbi:hypothetical protein QTI24_28695, partial [Variovorax sp. J22P240]|uniref:hypothetical protein n=1 Tax=Variovorax sp. J22P240 TaxID=3053514 RepID=UPI00257791FB